MGMLIATENPYTLILIGFCIGVFTGIFAVGLAAKILGGR